VYSSLANLVFKASRWCNGVLAYN